jgi:hypothetical protein
MYRWLEYGGASCCAVRATVDDVNVLYSRSPIARQDKTALTFPSTRQLKIEMRKTHKNDDAREFI